MKFNCKKIFAALFIVFINFYNAQSNGPGCNPFTGCPKSPIDTYVYVLAGIAVIGIAYFGRKYKTNKI